MAKKNGHAQGQNAAHTTVGHNAGIMGTLDGLYQKQVVWANTALKAANDGLIDLLGECLAVYYQLQKDGEARKHLGIALKALGLEAKDGVHVATRVTRYVFRSKATRVTGYASIVRAAIDAKRAQDNFAAWIKECGGLDQVRRIKKGSATGGVTPRQLSDQAAATLGTVQAGHVIRKPAGFLKPSGKALENFALALVRYNSQTGDAEIVYGTDNAALTRRFLTVVSKDVINAANTVAASANRIVQRAAQKAAIQAVVDAGMSKKVTAKATTPVAA